MSSPDHEAAAYLALAERVKELEGRYKTADRRCDRCDLSMHACLCDVSIEEMKYRLEHTRQFLADKDAKLDAANAKLAKEEARCASLEHSLQAEHDITTMVAAKLSVPVGCCDFGVRLEAKLAKAEASLAKVRGLCTDHDHDTCDHGDCNACMADAIIAALEEKS